MGCGSSKFGSSKINVQPIDQNGNSLNSKKDADVAKTNRADILENFNKNELKTNGVAAHDLGSSDKLLTSANDSFRVRKRNLLNTVESFEEIDKRSSFVSSAIRTNAEQLVKYLIEPYANIPLLRLRAIWIWVTNNITYNVKSYFNPQESTSQADALDALNSGCAVCSGYSNLIKLLAEHAGIKVEKVNGWSKGYSYVTGTKFTGSDPNHSWNAVYLDNNWWLLDATWGAGHVDENKTFIQHYTEHYFLTDPREFIYDHFPVDHNWQLLEKLVPIELFENYVRVTKHFFGLKMKLFTHTEGTVDCNTGKLHFKFRLDKDTAVKCIGKLWENNNIIEGGERYLHVYSTEKTLHMLADIPHKGNFELKLFAKKVEGDGDTLPMICSYMINCTGKLGLSSTFPKQFNKWNPGFYLHSPTDGILHNEETYKFRITLPNVSDMAICLGGRNSTWERITRTRDALWEGEITLPDWVERVNVVARFDSQNKKSPFSSVLEYKVIDKNVK